jgi:predicted dehydrogenase
MAGTHRIGIIGFAHMHVNNNAEFFRRHPRAKLVACADTVAAEPEVRQGPHTRGWNLRHAMTKLGVEKEYGDYREMLEKEKLDIVLCCAENARHAEVAEACAAHGAHVCLEKPMAGSMGEALRMARAAERHKKVLLTNWPLTWDGACRTAKALIDDGMIGRILQVKWRAGHTGPLGPGATHAGVADEAAPLSTAELAATWWHQDAAGGGAMLDYTCYGAMLARWYLGERAVAAVGMRANLSSRWSDADDNGIMIVRYPEALGLFEASWTQLDPGVTHGPIVYGTTGTLVVEERGGKRVVRLERGHGQTTVFTPEPLPAERDDIAKEFIGHLETGQQVHPTLGVECNLDITATLDAGLRAARSGKQELVESPAWQIG